MRRGIEVFDELAHLYEQRFMDVSDRAEGLDVLLDELPGNRVLDVGCGPGNVAAYAWAKRRDLDWLGVDLSPNMVRLASKNVPGARFQVMDAREIDALPSRFHAVVAAFCLPYLNPQELRMFCERAAALLHPGGLLYLSAMAGQTTHRAPQVNSQGDELLTWYHAPADLLAAVRERGFEVRRTWPPEPTLADLEHGKDMVILAAKAV
jgi:cyclopropane fatty-acyl-phospholipid synthase-like methyltransferase